MGATWRFVLTMVLLLICAEARAQASPCRARGLDAFESARRARRVVEDYAALRASIWRDLDHLERAQLSVGQAAPSARYFAAPIVDLALWPTWSTCDQGGRRSADLQALRAGGIVGAQLREHALRVELFWIAGGDALSFMVPAPSGEQAPESVTLGQSQRMIGGRAQLSSWVDLTLGVISDEAPTGLSDDAASGERRSTLYMALGIPRFQLRSDVIFGAQDQTLQKLYLNLERLPITSSGVALTARGGYVEDERQVITALGLAWPLYTHGADQAYRAPSDPGVVGAPTLDYTSLTGSSVRLYPEISVEWDSPRLRHARLRVEAQRVVWSAYEDQAVAGVMGVPYADMSLFWEGTRFGSGALEQRVGVSDAWGYGGGASLLFGLRPMSIALDTSVHLNRPETLAQLSELVGAGEWRMSLSWRLGW